MPDRPGIGLLIVTFSVETGPAVFLNDSQLDEVARLFLSVRGFTVIMTGINYKFHGPGKIRGTLAVPSTEYYAIAFDVIVSNIKETIGEKTQQYSPVILFLIVPERLIQTVRLNLDKIEQWLQKETMDLRDKSDITTQWFKRVLTNIKMYIHELKKPIQMRDSKNSLYDATILLSLPSASNHIAQTILRIQRQNSPKGATIKLLKQETSLKENEIKQELGYLSRRGLIEIHEIENEIFYYAPKPQ